MVAKIITGKSIKGMLLYNETKVESHQARLILANGFAAEIEMLSLQQKIQRFKNLTDLKPNVKTNVIHISLNFDISENLDRNTLQQIALTYMEMIGFGSQPFIVYEHLDAAHQHLHIASTIIQKNGERIATHNLGKILSEPARKKIENQFGLVVAQNKPHERCLLLKPVLYGKTPTKQAISAVLRGVRDNYAFSSLAQYNALLSELNVKALTGDPHSIMFHQKGLLYTVLDVQKNPIGVPIKASSFCNKPTLKNLEQNFIKGQEMKKTLKDSLIRRIEICLQKYHTLTLSTLIKELSSDGIAPVFRTNENGKMYGITFIDHKQCAVFNGSELGKSYSAMALAAQLSTVDQIKSYLRPSQSLSYLPNQIQSINPSKSLLINPAEILFEKNSYDEPSVFSRRKKRKKQKSTMHNL